MDHIDTSVFVGLVQIRKEEGLGLLHFLNGENCFKGTRYTHGLKNGKKNFRMCIGQCAECSVVLTSQNIVCSSVVVVRTATRM